MVSVFAELILSYRGANTFDATVKVLSRNEFRVINHIGCGGVYDPFADQD